MIAPALARRRAPTLTRSAVEGLIVAGACLLCAAWALRLWHADLGVPLRYTAADDAKFYLMLVKGIIAHGSYLSNPSLGAPFGQHLYDLPQGADNLSLLFLRGLTSFSSNPALIVNVFYLLTYALTGVACHFVLRALALSAPVAAVISVLFSLLTYHFFRGESHLFLSAYYAVPLAAYLFLSLLTPTPRFARRTSPHPPARAAWVSSRSVATVALCAVIGSANLYYAIFALALLVSASAIAGIRRRRRPACEGLLIVSLITLTLAVNLAPSIVYRFQHGTNAAVERSAQADANSNQAFALSPLTLVLPAPGDRIAALRHITARYDHSVAPRYCESCYASLGAVGTIGFGWIGVGALSMLLGSAGWIGSRRLLPHAGLGVAVALAVGTVGGLGSLFEVFISPDIRAWNRISVVIAFFSLLAAALLLEGLLAPLRRRRFGPALVAGALAAVLAFGVYDQTTTAFVPAYAANARQWHSDQAYVAAIEAALPRGAAVFQLPYVPFPEGYPQTRPSDQVATYATKYELLRGYLHSSTLRWSYGAAKGRNGDWAAALAGQPLPAVMAGAVAAGFDGVWVDPAGFEPAKAARVRSSLRALLGVNPLSSPDRDLWFFDLRPYRSRLQLTHPAAQLALLRERTLHPLVASCVRNGLKLSNPSGAAVQSKLTVHLLAGGILSRPVTLAPGASTVRVSGAVAYATLIDARLASLARADGSGPDSLVAGLTGPPCPP